MNVSKPKSVRSERDSMSYYDHLAKHPEALKNSSHVINKETGKIKGLGSLCHYKVFNKHKRVRYHE